jgi:dTDP-4-dehydrorhamnose reductase
MLGNILCRLLKQRGHDVAGLDITSPAFGDSHSESYNFVQCDITDYASLERIVKRIKPEIVIHTAAFTDVDACELEPDKAELINGLGTQYTAEAALQGGARIVYISTDFVFDGSKTSPYTERDTPNPVNVYGKSKLDGERFVADRFRKGDFFVIRSSWMFGPNGKNFIETVLRAAKAGKKLRIVTDQFGSPTYTVDLASGVCDLMEAAKGRDNAYGVYHITNSGDCSWYRLAEKALELSNIYDVELLPIVSEELSRPAERPRFSVLDNSRYIHLTGKPLRSWEKALEDYIAARRRDV